MNLETLSSRRGASLIGAWTLTVTGAAHAAIIAVGTPASAAEQATRQMMSDTHVVIGGLDRTVTQLFMGFSLAMALFIVGLGALNLLVLRRAPQLFLDSSAALWLNLAIGLPALVLAALLFPPPPIVLLAVACTAFSVALIRPRTSTLGNDESGNSSTHMPGRSTLPVSGASA